MFRDAAKGITADTVCNEGDNFPLHNQPPVDTGCGNCRVVNVYLTILWQSK